VFRRAAVAVLLSGLFAALALGPAGTASASLGSVPAEVAAYVANGGMVTRLNNVYGKNASGAGVDFNATTKAGAISRVYEWTSTRLTNVKTDHPVQLTNNWVVPITIADKPVGLATIWINPQSAAPELANFDQIPGLAKALEAVPATAALVRDTTTHAWLALDAGTVTPLIAGTSGLSTPAAVDSLTLSAGATPATPRQPAAGLVLAIFGVGGVVAVLLVALLLPRGRAARARKVRDAAASAIVGEASAIAEPAPPPAPAPVPAPKSPATRPARAAKASTPVTKPASSKPGGSKPGSSVPGSRKPASATASTKPRAQKPAAQKPPVQKPPVQKPPAQMPRAQKPPSAARPAPTPRPDSDPDSPPDVRPEA
jgi:hypothetical protein